MRMVLVRGIGDHASAVAHALFGAGHALAIHAEPRPADPHRGPALTHTVWDGRAGLAGVVAVRVDDVQALAAVVAAREEIAVATAGLADVLAAPRPDVLVDARKRKRETPEQQRGLAPLTVGVGPGFVAGENVDLAVGSGIGADFGWALDSGAPRKRESRRRCSVRATSGFSTPRWRERCARTAGWATRCALATRSSRSGKRRCTRLSMVCCVALPTTVHR